MDTCRQAGPPTGRQAGNTRFRFHFHQHKNDKKDRMYIVYAILSEVDGRIYVGMSQDAEKRLKEHNSGKTRSTKGYRPWRLFFTEEHFTREEARKREIYWKSGIGKEQLKEILSKNNC
ncbi:MAG TPA: GIY-YIG nuclease family protein [Christiangramia sp.]|nr:GIY-YIG nuclease family protein [Christiangramia sp.]